MSSSRKTATFTAMIEAVTTGIWIGRRDASLSGMTPILTSWKKWWLAARHYASITVASLWRLGPGAPGTSHQSRATGRGVLRHAPLAVFEMVARMTQPDLHVLERPFFLSRIQRDGDGHSRSERGE